MKEKIKDYKPDSPFVNIKPVIILKLLDEKKAEENKKDLLLKQKKEEAGIEEGDYIYIQKIEWGKEVKEFGLAKKIQLDYNNALSIQYNKLKKDLSESRLPLKEVKGSEIFSVLSPDIFLAEIRQSAIKFPIHVIKLVIDKGKRNPTFYMKRLKVKK